MVFHLLACIRDRHLRGIRFLLDDGKKFDVGHLRETAMDYDLDRLAYTFDVIACDQVEQNADCLEISIAHGRMHKLTNRYFNGGHAAQLAVFGYRHLLLNDLPEDRHEPWSALRPSFR